MQVDESVRVWLVGLGVEKEHAGQVLDPVPWCLATKFAQVVLLTRGKIDFLHSLKNVDSSGARLYNWNLVFEAFKKVGFSCTQFDKPGLVSGEGKQLARLLLAYKLWVEGSQGKPTLTGKLAVEPASPKDNGKKVVQLLDQELKHLLLNNKLSVAEAYADFRLIYFPKTKDAQGKLNQSLLELISAAVRKKEELMVSQQNRTDLLKLLAPGLAYPHAEVASDCLQIIQQTLARESLDIRNGYLYEQPVQLCRYLTAMTIVHPSHCCQAARIVKDCTLNLDQLFKLLSRLLVKKKPTVNLLYALYPWLGEWLSPGAKAEVFNSTVVMAQSKGQQISAIRMLSCLVREDIGSKDDYLRALQLTIESFDNAVSIFGIMEFVAWLDHLAEMKDSFVETIVHQLGEILLLKQREDHVVEFLLQQVHYLVAKYSRLPLDGVVAGLGRIVEARRDLTLLSRAVGELHYYWAAGRLLAQSKSIVLDITVAAMRQSVIMWLLCTGFLLRHSEQVKELANQNQIFKLCEVSLKRVVEDCKGRRRPSEYKAPLYILRQYVSQLKSESKLKLLQVIGKLSKDLKQHKVIIEIKKLLQVQEILQMSVNQASQVHKEESRGDSELARPRPKIQSKEPTLVSVSTKYNTRAINDLYRLKLTIEHKELALLQQKSRNQRKQDFAKQRTTQQLLQRRILVGKVSGYEPENLLHEIDSVRQSLAELSHTDEDWEEDRYCLAAEGVVQNNYKLLKSAYEVLARRDARVFKSVPKLQFQEQVESSRLQSELSQIKVQVRKEDLMHLVRQLKGKQDKTTSLSLKEFLAVVKDIGYFLLGKESSLMRVQTGFPIFIKALLSHLKVTLEELFLPLEKSVEGSDFGTAVKQVLPESWVISSQILNQVAKSKGYVLIESNFKSQAVKQPFRLQTVRQEQQAHKSIPYPIKPLKKVFKQKQPVNLKDSKLLKKKQQQIKLLIASDRKKKMEAAETLRRKEEEERQSKEKILKSKIAAERAKVQQLLQVFKQKRKQKEEREMKEQQKLDSRTVSLERRRKYEDQITETLAKIREDYRERQKQRDSKPAQDLTSTVLEEASQFRLNEKRFQSLLYEKRESADIKDVFQSHSSVLNRLFAQYVRLNRGPGKDALEFKTVLQLLLKSRVIPKVVNSQVVKREYLLVVKKAATAASIDLEQLKYLLVRLCAYRDHKPSDDPADKAAKVTGEALAQLIQMLKLPDIYEQARPKLPIDRHIKEYLQKAREDFSDYVRWGREADSPLLKASQSGRLPQSLPPSRKSEFGSLHQRSK